MSLVTIQNNKNITKHTSANNVFFMYTKVLAIWNEKWQFDKWFMHSCLGARVTQCFCKLMKHKAYETTVHLELIFTPMLDYANYCTYVKLSSVKALILTMLQNL